MSKPRLVPVSGVELEALLAKRDDLGTPWVATDGHGTSWCDVDDLRAWQALQASTPGKEVKS